MKQNAGLLKPDLVALVALDSKYPDDQLDLRLLRDELALTTSVVDVPHDEWHACTRAPVHALKRHPSICDRARGRFHLVQVPIARVNTSAIERAICQHLSKREKYCAHYVIYPASMRANASAAVGG